MVTKHVEFMRQALLESKKALPICLPNLPVGCVLVKEGKVLAKGYTHAPGEFHAEAHALSQVSQTLEEVSTYVTLEACAFLGEPPLAHTNSASEKLRAFTLRSATRILEIEAQAFRY